jgi:hypothetical protein
MTPNTPTHDTPETGAEVEAALAEAIHQARHTTADWKGNATAEHAVHWDRLMAKRALAAMPDWTLVQIVGPDDESLALPDPDAPAPSEPR